MSGALQSCDGPGVSIDGISLVVGDHDSTASPPVGDFDNFTMQLAIIGDPFLPDREAQHRCTPQPNYLVHVRFGVR